MRVLNVLLSSVILLSCSSVWRSSSNRISYKVFSELNPGVDRLEKIKINLGEPSKVYFLGEKKQIVEKSDSMQWVYNDKGLARLYLYFEQGVLESKTWNVKEEEKESSIQYMLEEHRGDWVVIQEPLSNPHLAPTECYLEDLQKAKNLRVSSSKKIILEISNWVSRKKEKSIKERLSKHVGKEFCLANKCAKITKTNAWEHNQCEWLEKLVEKTNVRPDT